MTKTRQNRAFCRKLYLAHLISSSQQNLRSLMALTGMPRRTIQDSIADFADVHIECRFVQAGVRNNDGYYEIISWGPINQAWVSSNIAVIKQALTDEPR